MTTFYDIPFDKPVKGPDQKVEKTAFFLTPSHSRITQNGKFVGLKKIQVTGKSIVEHNTTLRGDLAKIKIGYYVVIGDGSILKPAEKFGEEVAFKEMTIGDYTVIGKHCVIRAVQIGSCCWIGEGSVISNRCMLEDCGMVLDNTVLAPGTVVPPYTVFGGNPGRCVGRLPPTFDMIMNEHTHAFYAAFKAELVGTLHRAGTAGARYNARGRQGHGASRQRSRPGSTRSSGSAAPGKTLQEKERDSRIMPEDREKQLRARIKRTSSNRGSSSRMFSTEERLAQLRSGRKTSGLSKPDSIERSSSKPVSAEERAEQLAKYRARKKAAESHNKPEPK